MMRIPQINKYFTILFGLTSFVMVLYICYPRSPSQIQQRLTDDTKENEQLNEDHLTFKNILKTMKRNLLDQILRRNISKDTSAELDSDDAQDLSADEIFDLIPAHKRPQPLEIPITTRKEECLPYKKDLRVKLVNDHDCDQPHVLMNLGGRLGNKLCQYASVYLLRHLYGIRVAIRKSMKINLSRQFKNMFLPAQESGCFTNATTNILYDAILMKLYKAANEARVTAKDKNFIQTPLLNQSYYVYNNPAPRALLMDHRDLVRTIIRFKDDVISKAIGNIDEAIKPFNATYYRRNFKIVSVHARRTDYTGYIKRKYNLTQLDDIYFKRAFDFFRKRLDEPLFLVLSDDRTWCRLNLAAKDVVIMAGAPPTVDMATVTLADHHITSYGTYSFIGALLGRGHITHPISHKGRYNLFHCLREPYFHFISRDETYEIDNSQVKLV